MGFISGNRKIYKHDRKILFSNLGIWGEEVSKSMKVAKFLKREKENYAYLMTDDIIG